LLPRVACRKLRKRQQAADYGEGEGKTSEAESQPPRAMTNPVLDPTKIVGRGFLLGIGFSIAFGIFALAAFKEMRQSEVWLSARLSKLMSLDVLHWVRLAY
jgi:hypothetical protein